MRQRLPLTLRARNTSNIRGSADNVVTKKMGFIERMLAKTSQNLLVVLSLIWLQLMRQEFQLPSVKVMADKCGA